MSAEQSPEPPSKLAVFAIHVALALPLNVLVVPLAFELAMLLRGALFEPMPPFGDRGLVGALPVLLAAVVSSAMIQALTIARAGRRHKIAWGALFVYPLGLILTVLACDLLFHSPQLALLDAAALSIHKHGFFLVRSIEGTLPYGGLQRFLMILVLSPVFLVVGLFDILLMPFVPLTDPEFYLAVLKLIPYFCVVLLGSALPCWAVARRGRVES